MVALEMAALCLPFERAATWKWQIRRVTVLRKSAVLFSLAPVFHRQLATTRAKLAVFALFNQLTARFARFYCVFIGANFEISRSFRLICTFLAGGISTLLIGQSQLCRRRSLKSRWTWRICRVDETQTHENWKSTQWAWLRLDVKFDSLKFQLDKFYSFLETTVESNRQTTSGKARWRWHSNN